MRRTSLILIIAALWLQVSGSAAAAAAGTGTTGSDIVRFLGLIAAVGGVIVLVLTEFVFKRRLARGTYHWLLLMGMLFLPVMALMGGVTTAFEETKTVDSCYTCHNMHVFVDDMKNEQSSTLAARHFRNGWIPADQCYACHTTYGIHGTAEGKRDGFRHWLMYVTETWEEPIQFRGSYPNANCLGCHAPTTTFQNVQSHQSLRADLDGDRVSCVQCHGPPHPAPPERQQSATGGDK